ncbi:MAG: helix-turn-helix domain-containing protein [Ilumatobacteraceae bacterium]
MCPPDSNVDLRDRAGGSGRNVRAKQPPRLPSSFRRDGDAGGTVDAIADDAGFTKGAVSARFGSRADLFLSLLEERIEARARSAVRRCGSINARWRSDRTVFCGHPEGRICARLRSS